eukprot:m.454164 g.454164  ORF g.454164 m.454164 type:complete len:343 (+) comp21564_c2_seq2:488-1516(+)
MDDEAAEKSSVSDTVYSKISAVKPDDVFLDLAKSALAIVPLEIYKFTQLEGLFFEGNQLEYLPDDMFEHLPALDFLDLRNNNLISIPSSIGMHRRLRTLLLEGNNIENLPLTLGFVETLTALSLTGNPLTSPPRDIVEGGVQSILRWLRDEESLTNKMEQLSIALSDEEETGSPSHSPRPSISPEGPRSVCSEASITVNSSRKVAEEVQAPDSSSISISMPTRTTEEFITTPSTVSLPTLGPGENSVFMDHTDTAASSRFQDIPDSDTQRTAGQRNYTSPDHADLFGVKDSAKMLASSRPLTKLEKDRVRTTSGKYRAELNAKIRAKSAARTTSARRQHKED